MNQRTEKKVIKYIKGELSGKELTDFKSLITSNKEIRELVEYYKLMGLALDLHEEESSSFQKNKETLKLIIEEKQSKKIIWFWVVGFAIISLIIFTIICLKDNPTDLESSNEDIHQIEKNETSIIENQKTVPNDSIQNSFDSNIPLSPKPEKLVEDSVIIKPNNNNNNNNNDDLKIYSYLLNDNDILIDISSEISIMGSNWKTHLQNGKYEEALEEIQDKFINKKPMDEIEDIHLYYAGIIQLYYKKDSKKGFDLLNNIVSDQKFMDLATLHIFISITKSKNKEEIKLYYNNNKEILDRFSKANKYNITKVIELITTH